MGLFKQSKVLIFGDLILDEWLYGDATRLSPEAPVPVVHAQKSKVTLGGAGNVAANIASLGGIPLMVSLTDNGPSPGLLLAGGIDAQYCICSQSRPVPHKTRVVANDHQICRIDREDPAPISEDLMQLLHGKLLAAIAKEEPDAIVVSDYNKGIVTNSMMLALMEAARNIPVLLDPKPVNVKAYPQSCHLTVMTPNLHEAEQMAGIKGDIDAIGRTLLTYYGCKYVVITQGENGMTGFWSEGPHSADVKSHHVPAVVHRVFDVAGAGDTVIAALALCIASKITPFSDVVFLANGFASAAVGKPGTVAVKEEDFPWGNTSYGSGRSV